MDFFFFVAEFYNYSDNSKYVTKAKINIISIDTNSAHFDVATPFNNMNPNLFSEFFKLHTFLTVRDVRRIVRIMLDP